MKDLARLIALGASTMVSASLIASCGSYDNGPKGGSGAGGTTSTGGTGGTMTTGGTGGTGGATGGSAGAATGGTGGATGGSSGASAAGTGGATGGSSGTGAAAGAGAGGAPTGGAAGSGGGAGMDAAGSGGGTQVSCTEVAACGGDVVGTWTAAGCEQTLSGMANLAAAGIGCVSAPIMGTYKVTGTFTAAADGMFTDNTTTAGMATMELAAECLMISGFMGTCDRLVFDSIGLVNVVCEDNTVTGGCNCDVPISQMGGLGTISLEASLMSANMGTYTAMDNKLVTTASTLMTEYSYCVTGSTLTVAATMPSNAGTVTGPIVLQKQ